MRRHAGGSSNFSWSGEAEELELLVAPDAELDPEEEEDETK